MPLISMADVGTRQDHLMELYDIWSAGLEILSRGKLTSGEEQQKVELEHAIKLLWYYLTIEYDAQPDIKTINELPEPPKENSNET
jgi:hypothetical protein